MKKLFFLSLIGAAVVCLMFVRPPARIDASSVSAAISSPISMRAAAFARSTQDLRSLNAAPADSQARVSKDTKAVSRGIVGKPDSGRVVSTGDSDVSLGAFGPEPMPTPTLSFDGIANIDNANGFSVLIIPPDMNGDVGPNN